VKHVFIINPIAGKKNASEELKAELAKLKDRLKLDIEVYLTRFPRHAEQLVKEIVKTGEAVRLYACGGDGTLNEVLSGAYGCAHAEVGHIPCGSGNDMIRNFGTAEEFRNLEAMVLGDSKTIDLIEANGRVVASICAAGLDGKVAYQALKVRKLPFCSGGIAYDIAALKCLFGKLWYRMKITIDGKKIEDDFILTAFGNGRFYGGGYKCLPGAQLDDGLLSVVMVRKLPFYKLLDALKKYKAGTHFDQNGCIVPEYQNVMTACTASEITLHCDRKFYYTVDGEIGHEHDLLVRILPSAVRFILPKTVCGA